MTDALKRSMKVGEGHVTVSEWDDDDDDDADDDDIYICIHCIQITSIF